MTGTGPRGQPDTDELVLLQRARAGDRAALSRLLEPYLMALHRRAMLRLGDESLAWDCVQETLVRAFRYLDSYDSSRPFRSWITAIAANCARDLAHRRAGHVLLTEDIASSAPGPEERAASSQRMMWLEICLSRLPIADRRLFTAVGLKGLPHRDVAAALEMTAVACRKRYERILPRRRLRCARCGSTPRRRTSRASVRAARRGSR
jgi:RNA polymerase sigma-70 factor (ECF subfamily)